MGKKKVIQQTEEQAIKENEQLEKNVAKAAGSSKPAEAGKTGGSKKIESGKVYINATYNNTLITVTNARGDAIASVSSGSLGFSGPKKATPFAASKTVAALAEKIRKIGLVNVDVIVKGVGSGRDSAIRSLSNQGFNIISIKDCTPIPHNGPKPKKPRRI